MAMFVLIYWLREFPLSAVTNRFELSSLLKQLLLLFDKIRPRYCGCKRFGTMFCKIDGLYGLLPTVLFN